MPRKGSLPSRLAALGLLLLCIALVVMLGVVPIVRDYAAYDAIIADARDQLAEYAARRKDTGQLQAQLTRIKATGRTQETYLREKTPSLAAASLLGRIKSTVQQHKGTLSSAQILSTPEKAENPKVTVRAHLQVSPDGLQKIFHQLESGTPALFLDNVMLSGRLLNKKVKRRGEKDQSWQELVLDTQFNVTGYLQKASGQ